MALLAVVGASLAANWLIGLIMFVCIDCEDNDFIPWFAEQPWYGQLVMGEFWPIVLWSVYHERE